MCYCRNPSAWPCWGRSCGKFSIAAEMQMPPALAVSGAFLQANRRWSFDKLLASELCQRKSGSGSHLPIFNSCHRALRNQKLFGRFRIHGPRKEVALAQLTTHLPEESNLLRAFDALGNDFHAEIFCQHYDNANDLLRLGIAVHLGDESSVNLHHVHGKFLQPAERRISRTEIVDAETYAKRLQLG